MSFIKETWHDWSLFRRFFIIVCAIMVSISAVELLGGWSSGTQLGSIRNYVFFRSSEDDSWEPMLAAINYLQSENQEPIYDALFFDGGLKFQYPLTSLLFIQSLNAVWRTESPSIISLLNVMNWIGILVIALVSIQLFFISWRKFFPDTKAGKRFTLLDLGVLLVSCLFFYPVVFGYTLGQVQIWIGVFFSLACLAWVNDNKRLAGVLVALACLFKPQYGLFLVWGLIRREWKFARWAIIVLSIGGLTALLVYGLDHNLNYLGLSLEE